MAVFRYPQEVHEFVKANATAMRDKELAEECNRRFGTEFTASKMKAFRTNHSIHNGMKQWTREEYWKYQTKWPKGMYEFIRDRSWGMSSKELAEMVNEKFGTNFTPKGMKDFRSRYGIKAGCPGWYQRMHEPGNKGRKQAEYCSPDSLKKQEQTQFKCDGVLNSFPVGSVRVNNAGYKLVKVSDSGTTRQRWNYLHRHVW